MRIANPFRYMLRESYPSTGTVYKAWFGKKYLVWKAKSLHQSVNTVAKEIDQRMRLGLKLGDPFEKVVEHIRRARVTIFEVEAIKQSDNPAELLIEEYKLLKAGQTDPACLNTSWFPYIPKWVPESAEKEFKDWIAKQQAAAKKTVKSRPKKKVQAKGKVAPKASKSKKNGPGAAKMRKVMKKGKRG